MMLGIDPRRATLGGRLEVKGVLACLLVLRFNLHF